MKPLFTTFFILACWPAVLFAQLDDDFESGLRAGWLQDPDNRWSASSLTPLSGAVSLRHSFDNTAAGVDMVYRTLAACHPPDNDITWRFLLRHGYNPSGSNKWAVVLMADAPGAHWRSGGLYQAYVIGVNQGSATDDTLSLYAVRNNTFTTICKTRINWEKDIKATGTGALEVTRRYDGLWTIRVATSGLFSRLDTVAAPVRHAAYTAAEYFGLIYSYTPAADQLLWWDEVSITALAVIPPPPPYEPAFGDIVFNEIMAKADPSNGLPEAQYIELYNRSAHEITLEGWKINYNGVAGNIGAAVMPPRSYLLLCSTAQLAAMREYGSAATVTNMASLTRAGKTLLLKNAAGDIMARTAYTDKWIADESKRTGGWSLEKLDPDNLSEAPDNWGACEAELGGSPGTANSQLIFHPDEDPPYITELALKDEHRLAITLNEWFNRKQALLPEVYRVNQGIGYAAAVLPDAENPLQLTLQFDKAFERGTLYSLSLLPPFCDMAGNWPDATAYPFADLPEPQKGEVVINELLFHPFSGGADFVELYNCSDKTFNAAALQLANRNKAGEPAALTGPPPSYYLQPGDYVVFTTSLEAVQLFYTVPSPEKVLLLPALPSYPNSEGCALLMNSQGEILDECCYTEKMHSSFISNPAGVALERVNPAVASTEPSNWQSAAQQAGWATPTYRNSQFNDREQAGEWGFALAEEIFSPNGDGYQDLLYIDFCLPGPDYMATITVYDVQGRPVRALENNILLGTQGRLCWDGARDDRQMVSPGIYIIFVRAYDAGGNLQTYKLSCVAATSPYPDFF